MKIAAIAVALVYLVSFVIADEPKVMNPGLRGSAEVIDPENSGFSKSEREEIVKIIKEMLLSHPEANVAAANLLLEQLEPDTDDTGTRSATANVLTNPAVISHAGNIIIAGARRDPATVAGHTVGLIGAAVPAAMATIPEPVTPVNIPSRTFTMSSTTSNRDIPLLPDTGSPIRAMTNAAIAAGNVGPRLMPPRSSND